MSIHAKLVNQELVERRSKIMGMFDMHDSMKYLIFIYT
jgi:hypothetical protein